MIPAVNAHGRIALPADRIILAAIFLAGLLFYNLIQIHNDVAWFIYCNLRQLESMRPYIDFIEVNPPISFYLTLPPVAFAAATGLPIKLSLVIYVLAITAGSLFVVTSLDNAASPDERRWTTVARAIILMVFPIMVFAQREHFAILLGLPYFYLCAARLRGESVSPRLAVTIGLMAGIGLSIKHYFLLAPLMVEAYLIYTRGSIRSLRRIEIGAAIFAGSLYAAFVVIAHPEFFTVAVPLTLAAYEAYSRPYWLVALQPWNTAAILGFTFWLLARRYVAKVPSVDLLFVAALAFLLCVFWQDKGWAYHTLPANVMLALAAIELLTATVSGRTTAKGLSRRQKWTITAAPILLILGQTLLSGPYYNKSALDLAKFIEKYAPHGSVFVMSSNLSAGFPLALDAHVTWASRFPTQWLLPGIIRGEQAGDALTPEQRSRLKWLSAFDMDATVADFEKSKPDIVFVDRFYQDGPSRLYDGIQVDLISHYLRDARFAKIWAHYRKVDAIKTHVMDDERTFDVWVR